MKFYLAIFFVFQYANCMDISLLLNNEKEYQTYSADDMIYIVKNWDFVEYSSETF